MTDTTDFAAVMASSLLLPGIVLGLGVSFDFALAFRLGKSDSRGVGNRFLLGLPTLEFVDQVIGKYQVLGIIIVALGEGVLEILGKLAAATAIALMDKHSSKI
jgi:hypothetical protein